MNEYVNGINLSNCCGAKAYNKGWETQSNEDQPENWHCTKCKKPCQPTAAKEEQP